MRLRCGTAAVAWCCGCGVEGVEHGGAWSTEARAAGVMATRARVRERSGADGGGACAGGAEGRAGAHGWRWASARARRRRLDVQASGGERSRASGGAEGRRRRDVIESSGGVVKEEGKQGPVSAGKRHIRQVGPRFFLTPVDPTPRV